MKRGGWFILCLAIASIILASFSSAEITDTDKKIYDKWHFSGDTFTVDGEVFLVTHIRFTDEKIVLSINNKSVVINLDSCYDTDKKKYCFMGLFNDIENAKSTDHIKFVGGSYVYAGLLVQVYSRGTDVTATRKYTPAPVKDTEIEVELKLKNPTDFWTENFVYEDAYPEGVMITGGSGSFEKASRSVKYRENLPPNSEQTFRYTFRILDYLSFTNYATVSYKAGGANKTFNTTKYSVDLTDAKPYTLTTKLSASTIEPSQDFTLTLSLKNKKGTKLKIERVTLTVPSQDLSFNYDPGLFTKSGSDYTWSGEIINGTTKDLEIRLKAYKSGKYSIPLLIEVKGTASVSYVEKKPINFTVSYKAPEVILSVKEATVSEGGLFRAALSIKNPNKHTVFKDVIGWIRSNISTEASGVVPQILPGDTRTIAIKDEILAPTVTATTKFNIQGSGEYDTAYESGTSFSKNGTVTVTPVNKSITITQTITKPKDIHVGDNVTVTVKIKHANEEIVNVDVKDTYSPGLNLIGGKATEELYFDKASEKQAYIYSVVIPPAYESPELFIKTEASVRGKPGVVTQIAVLLVNQSARPTPEELAANATALNSSGRTNETGNGKTDTKASEPGFFTKIVNGVTDFFTRLFGFD